MDNTLLIAVVTAGVGQFVLGIFNSLTMRTRTKADLEAAIINAGVAKGKNEIEEDNAAVGQWKGLYDTVKTQRDEALARCKELEAELKARPPAVVVEKTEPVMVRNIEL